MIDGIIAESKNSRKMKADIPETYEELRAILADSGLPLDLLLNEAGWRQLPTFLNKANLLTDLTEKAIWGNSSNRTVDGALKMLADVAYGRVASIELTVLDTDGNPIPDVTVKLDSTPIVGTDPRTDENGYIHLDTSGGTHILYLTYPIGYDSENTNQTIEVSGTKTMEVVEVSQRNQTYFQLTASKQFYIARYLSPVEFDIRGGGGSGRLVVFRGSTSEDVINFAQGGAGGYVNLTGPIDVSGLLIRVAIGAGGTARSATTTTAQNGARGGTSTVYVGEQSFSASGGAGGNAKQTQNTDGGAPGGAGWRDGFNLTETGGDGPNLFGDLSLPKQGAGGGGTYVEWDVSSSRNHIVYAGDGGEGGGTDALANASSGAIDRVTDSASHASGSGACIVCLYSSSYTNGVGKGGDGFVAFRKAV